MPQVDLIMPKMGESIMEATILKWVKKVGDTVEMDETILEIATDKVDSEVPSPVAGTIAQILFEENDVVEIGKTIAVIATEGDEVVPAASPAVKVEVASPPVNGHTNGAPNGTSIQSPKPAPALAVAETTTTITIEKTSSSGRFYSPLVRNIAKKEGIRLVK